MFTGIIEGEGLIREIQVSGSNKIFRMESELAPQLAVDQSLSHDGVCLTVESVSGNGYTVTAISETLSKTQLDQWKPGDGVNLERCLRINGRLDGHIVQGHVDTTAVCIGREDKAGSWVFRFEFPQSFNHLVIEKGSVAVNGISLTCYDIKPGLFSVAIIPYTFEHTNMKALKPGGTVNLEFDMIGKYVSKWLVSR